DAITRAPVFRSPGRHDQPVGPGSGNHRGLRAIQDIVVALTARRGSNVTQVIAALFFGPCQCPYGPSSHDRDEMLLTLRDGADRLDQPTGDDNGFKERFDDQMTAEFLHDEHGRQRSATEATALFIEWRGT